MIHFKNYSKNISDTKEMILFNQETDTNLEKLGMVKLDLSKQSLSFFVPGERTDTERMINRIRQSKYPIVFWDYIEMVNDLNLMILLSAKEFTLTITDDEGYIIFNEIYNLHRSSDNVITCSYIEELISEKLEIIIFGLSNQFPYFKDIT